MSRLANEPSLRTIELAAAGDGRSETTWCSVPGCGHATSHHKPYCFAHLDLLPYVRKLRRELAVAEALAAPREGLRRAV
ncbi:MAG TPA: hypothetical protein VFF73_09300 [Planctomycetota bacterium]|nr:hypothetical protein [Planctomycetota bacterium]